MNNTIRTMLAVTLATMAAAPALAHPGGHGGALAAGLLHPLTGLDHLLALAAAGAWSARQARGAVAPALFAAMLAALAAGAAAGMAGFSVPGLETGLAATVVATGLLLAATTTALPPLVALPLFAGFAILHGNAHGLELAPAAMAGFLVASAMLLAAGRRLGSLMPPAVARLAGGCVAVAGMALLA